MIIYLIGFFVFAVLAILISIYRKKRGLEGRLFFYSSILYIFFGILLIPSWFVYIGLGFILFGIGLYFLDKFNLHLFLKFAIIILPIAIISILLYIESPSYNIFLIPKDFKGRVLIIHNCKDGIEKEFDGSYRVYRIPKTGILKTKFSFKGNSFDGLNSSFYFIDEAGQKEEILYLEYSDNTEKIYAFGLWTLSLDITKGEQNFNFIVNSFKEEYINDSPEEKEQFQKEFDSCYE